MLLINSVSDGVLFSLVRAVCRLRWSEVECNTLCSSSYVMQARIASFCTCMRIAEMTLYALLLFSSELYHSALTYSLKLQVTPGRLPHGWTALR